MSHTPPPVRAALALVSAADAPTDNAQLKTLVVPVAGFVPDGAPGWDAQTRDTGPDDDGPAAKVGDVIAGFRLTELLGQGAFARVFVAEQIGIANRRVVVKVTDRATPEAEKLGRLQHPNVVPIYSVHRASHFLICMPYLGRETLADRAGRAAQIAAPAARVRWVIETLAGLAAGLAHAHARGILHLDLKPANVLLPDTGEPMLLDFNLAHESGDARWLAGGTLPYMAPEQLAHLLADGPGRVDERTDLYGLGVVAFELLAGAHPYRVGGVTADNLHHHLDARTGPVPTLRDKNRAVSPAVEAIVRKLLAADPADRYQTALELKTDLDRHLADLPLASAPDRSARERFGKWRRRNPWVPLGALAALAVGVAAALALSQQFRKAADREAAAVAQAAGFTGRMASLRLDLATPSDPVARTRGRAAAEEHLARYSLPHAPDWRTRSAFARLPDAVKPAVAADLGELLLLMAHARWTESRGATPSDRAALTAEAVRLNAAAEGCFDPASVPAFVAFQRNVLTGTAVEPGDHRHPRDHYLTGVYLVSGGHLRQAVRSFTEATAGEPGHAAAHFALGYCRHQLGQYQRALERYDTAHALLPDDPRPVFNRGLVYGLQQKHGPAEEEFSHAIRIDPRYGEAYRNRAVARLRLDPPNARGAEQDLTAALQRGASTLQVLTLRAQVRTQLRDAAGAAQDKKAADEYAPRTDGDYLVRGRARLPADPAGALADFEAAARLNPASLPALQNQAHVLSDYLHDAARSLAAVTRAADLFPDYAPARAGRAVLLARAGKRDAAHLEAEAALRLSDDPRITYQVAGAFALSSVTHPADADRAITLLRQAVRDGFRDARTMDTDPDLDPVRPRPDFAALLTGLKALPR